MTNPPAQSPKRAQSALDAAIAALMADLGPQRREHIVTLDDDKGRRNRQGPHFEVSEAARLRPARAHQGALNAWNTLHESQEEGAIGNDDPDLVSSGQSHRHTVRSSLQQARPARPWPNQATTRGGPSGRGGRAAFGGRGGGRIGRTQTRLRRELGQQSSLGVSRVPGRAAEAEVRGVPPVQRHPHLTAAQQRNSQGGPGQFRALVETGVLAAKGQPEPQSSSADDLSGIVLLPQSDLDIPDRLRAHRLPAVDSIPMLATAELVRLSTSLHQTLAGLEASASAVSVGSVLNRLRLDICKVDSRLAFLGGGQGDPSEAGRRLEESAPTSLALDLLARQIVRQHGLTKPEENRVTMSEQPKKPEENRAATAERFPQPVSNRLFGLDGAADDDHPDVNGDSEVPRRPGARTSPNVTPGQRSPGRPRLQRSPSCARLAIVDVETRSRQESASPDNSAHRLARHSPLLSPTMEGLPMHSSRLTGDRLRRPSSPRRYLGPRVRSEADLANSFATEGETLSQPGSTETIFGPRNASSDRPYRLPIINEVTEPIGDVTHSSHTGRSQTTHSTPSASARNVRRTEITEPNRHSDQDADTEPDDRQAGDFAVRSLDYHVWKRRSTATNVRHPDRGHAAGTSVGPTGGGPATRDALTRAVRASSHWLKSSNLAASRTTRVASQPTTPTHRHGSGYMTTDVATCSPFLNPSSSRDSSESVEADPSHTYNVLDAGGSSFRATTSPTRLPEDEQAQARTFGSNSAPSTFRTPHGQGPQHRAIELSNSPLTTVDDLRWRHRMSLSEITGPVPHIEEPNAADGIVPSATATFPPRTSSLQRLNPNASMSNDVTAPPLRDPNSMSWMSLVLNERQADIVTEMIAAEGRSTTPTDHQQAQQGEASVAYHLPTTPHRSASAQDLTLRRQSSMPTGPRTTSTTNQLGRLEGQEFSKGWPHSEPVELFARRERPPPPPELGSPIQDAAPGRRAGFFFREGIPEQGVSAAAAATTKQPKKRQRAPIITSPAIPAPQPSIHAQTASRDAVATATHQPLTQTRRAPRDMALIPAHQSPMQRQRAPAVPMPASAIHQSPTQTEASPADTSATATHRLLPQTQTAQRDRTTGVATPQLPTQKQRTQRDSTDSEITLVDYHDYLR